MLLLLKRINYQHFIFDVLLSAFSLYASLYLRVGWPEFREHVSILNQLFIFFLLLRMTCFVALGVYDIKWRFVSSRDALKIVKAVMLSSLLIISGTYLLNLGRLPRATFVIDMVLVISLMAGARLFRRVFFEYRTRKQVEHLGRLTLIYGAGVLGRALATRFHSEPKLGFQVLGFIDDAPHEVGRVIGGVKVLGNRNDLRHLLTSYPIRELIVAISNVSGEILREVVDASRAFHIRPRLITQFSASKDKIRESDLFRNIELSDLLGRPKQTLDSVSVRQLVYQKQVLITGAGGSIGSELARQIARCEPRKLLLLDHSEHNLYEIDRELRLSSDLSGIVTPLLLDIKDRPSLQTMMATFQPEVVFHAAAYKHVHLVEYNPFSSILNNIAGTRNLVELSGEIGVGTFVLISTDKAVNPAGVMGATKRVCELIVTEAGERTGRNYCSVRFGNVLGSSGSLIPLLEKQILNGEPMTITHPEMTRYFMLISEAVALVLRASTVAKSGDVCILRMGDPIRIVSIAESLRTLLGRTENESPIVFTGLRPGEKLFEELYLCGDELNTEHPDILILPRGDRQRKGVSFDPFLFQSKLDALVSAAQQGKVDALSRLDELIHPSLNEQVTQKAVGDRY